MILRRHVGLPSRSLNYRAALDTGYSDRNLHIPLQIKDQRFGARLITWEPRNDAIITDVVDLSRSSA